MSLLELIANAWGWKGLAPKAVLGSNAFGNLIVLDLRGRYWRICPEELSCAPIADSDDEYEKLRTSASFAEDWAMATPRQEALAAFGPVPEGRCYCLKIPAVLGGKYEISNMATISLNELISFAGDVAQQIEGLPDGTQMEIQIVD